MGVLKMFSSSSYDGKSVGIFDHWLSENKNDSIKESILLPNPKADNYEILRGEIINDYFIIEIKYLDCINYEGRKILVFENCTIEDLKRQKLIDPHFSENKKYFSPIARFEPTERGWNMALKLCKNI